MPHVKWTHQEAVDYRRALKLQYGLSGHIEKSGGSGETTAQKYEMRHEKAKVKIANAQYMNKHGVLESRDELIKRKVQKDIGLAEQVNTQLVNLGKYVEAMSTGSTFIPGPIKT